MSPFNPLSRKPVDVVIVGAGLAGSSLALQLLRADPSLEILMLEKRAEVPPKGQKVGEATVQMSGYYFSKVLDLEEYLLREHFMKYNLRFYWKTSGSDNSAFEHYSQCYLRPMSNIASYQLDRNKIEGEMLRRSAEFPGFRLVTSAADLDISLAQPDASATGAPDDDAATHLVSFSEAGSREELRARWVVDTSGRAQLLARRGGLRRESPIRHGSSFMWVEGLLNIEKLTELSHTGLRLKRDRAHIGHMPIWLATNHFVGEGFWFWVIPLQGITSLGLVYDNRLINHEDVSPPRKLTEWVCREFPLFARDLPQRRVLHFSSLRDFAFDCAQTIDVSRWALAGEAGRFTDPLYSPGGDLIAIYNTLIADAILTDRRGEADEFRAKVPLYEQLMQTVYEAYVPSYAISYDALGDQEAMTLKYTWELTVYFSFLVFPFINDLFTDRRFVVSYLARFARLGRLNKNLQAFISAYFQWKKARPAPARPVFVDFMEIGYLKKAEGTFYRVGLDADEAREVLDAQLANLQEFARHIITHVHTAIAGDERLMTNRPFIEGLDPERVVFDPDLMRQAAAMYASASPHPDYAWSCETAPLARFRAAARPPVETHIAPASSSSSPGAEAPGYRRAR